MFITAILLLFALLILLTSIKVVNTGQVFVLERFGQYYKTLNPGWHVILPFVDYVRRKISMKQQILDIQPQTVITKDNVNISVDNVIFYQVLNPKDAVYNIENYVSGIMYATITNMRNIIGDMSLDEVLAGRDQINMKLLHIVDAITDAYGIKLLSVEIKNILPPAEIQNAMEKQMKAEREKRAAILIAEGDRESSIARAEGEKRSNILRAEAEKEKNIRLAEGLKESQLLEAEGKAKAIETIANAEAEAIRKVNTSIIESGTDARIIALKQVEALKELSLNPANKLILPVDALSSLGSIAAMADVIGEQRKS
ncbi:MAG TPA: peptidase [Clostridiaceae bacterium]|nr:peptidase [Clostridiaceae bacterium]